MQQELKDYINARTEQARQTVRGRLRAAIALQSDTVNVDDVTRAKAALDHPSIKAIVQVVVYDDVVDGQPAMGAAMSVCASEEAQHQIITLLELEMRTNETLNALTRETNPADDTCECPGCSRRRAHAAAQDTSGPSRDELQSFINALFGDRDMEGVTVVMLKADGDFGPGHPTRYEPEPEGGDTAH